MVIQTPDRSYQIISRRNDRETFEILLGRNPETEDIVYTLLRFLKPEEIHLILERNLLQKEITGNFVDYKESFLWQDSLIMVFVHRQGISLEQWLAKEPVPLSQRLEMGKHLLERLLLLNMPEYLLCGILNPECILITDAMEIVIQYEPTENILIGLEQGSSDVLHKYFYDVFTLLFQKEEKEQSSKELHSFLERLQKEPYQDVFYIYQIYDRMQDELLGRGNINQLVPNTWLNQWKERGLRLLAFGEKILPLLAVVIAMAVMIYLITHPQQEEAEPFIIDQIGTLQIQ